METTGCGLRYRTMDSMQQLFVREITTRWTTRWATNQMEVRANPCQTTEIFCGDLITLPILQNTLPTMICQEYTPISSPTNNIENAQPYSEML